MANDRKEVRIMIIDDSPEMIDILGNILPKHIKRQVALNGPSALKLLSDSSELPDLILLDVVMPIMSGFEVCTQIKKDPRLSHIPVIFISALDDTFDKVKAFSVGAVDYITKPFQREEVLLRINTHFKISSSRKEIHDLYSKTILGTVSAINDILSISNPRISNFSNSIKLYSEKIAKELSISKVWDLNLAAMLFGLGVISEDIHPEEKEDDRDKAYESLLLSKDIVSKIPKLESITEIMEISLIPIKSRYKNFPIINMEPNLLKGLILRTLIFYLDNLEKGKSGISLINQMKFSEDESYNLEILDALYKVENDLLQKDIIELTIEELEPNMVLADHLYYPSGVLMLQNGYELSSGSIVLIQKFYESEDMKIKVLNT